jgi:hypothetical protein
MTFLHGPCAEDVHRKLTSEGNDELLRYVCNVIVYSWNSGAELISNEILSEGGSRLVPV